MTGEPTARAAVASQAAAKAPLDQPVRRAGFSRVLLAYDGSISARQGLAWLPHVLAPVPGARAVVMHVHDVATKPKSALARQLGNEDLDGVVSALGAVGVDARPLLVAGDPAREIPRAAAQLKADLLVCGSRGRGPFGRKVMGSVADAMVRQTDVNLLVARTSALSARVIFATDGSMESVHACRFGVQLVQRWGVAGTLLQARPAEQAEEPFPAQLAVDILPRENAAFEALVRPGEPARAIVAAAAEVKAGVIVMGRRGSGRQDQLVGSTAASVARDAPASVLLVRRPPHA